VRWGRWGRFCVKKAVISSFKTRFYEESCLYFRLLNGFVMRQSRSPNWSRLFRDGRLYFSHNRQHTYTNGIFAISNEVDISRFEKGMYAVTIERDGKRIFTDKLVVNQ
jgi:hypothetical protein